MVWQGQKLCHQIPQEMAENSFFYVMVNFTKKTLSMHVSCCFRPKQLSADCSFIFRDFFKKAMLDIGLYIIF